MFRIIKPTTCTNFSILFWNETLHGSNSSSVHHHEYFTVHTAMVYVIPVCWQLAGSIIILLASCSQSCMTYTIAVCTVKNSWWWTEELSETCRVSFQNKIEKLVHLVGFIVRNLLRWTSNSLTMYRIFLYDIWGKHSKPYKIKHNKYLT